MMKSAFKKNTSSSSSEEVLQKVEYLLKLHGLETSDLIHQYYVERWEEQKKIEHSKFGILAVKAVFCESAVKIDVINARNLLPMDSNGS